MRIAGMYLSMDMKLFEDAYGKETGTGGQAGFPAGMVWKMEYNRMNRRAESRLERALR